MSYALWRLSTPKSESGSINRFVRKNKTNLSSKGSRIKPESRTDDLVSHLKEFEEWANPAFNVLIVQTPRPKFFESPILKAFRGTINETGELLKSILRFGLPETSVRNKLPYWRDDNSPLSTTPGVRLNKALKVMDQPRAPASMRAQAMSASSPHMTMSPFKASAHGHVRGRKPKFVFAHEIHPVFILALNVSAWWYLSTPAMGKGPPM